MSNVIKICGLDCANCARELEEEISQIEGVENVSVDFMAQKVVIDCGGDALEKAVKQCGSFEDVKVVEVLPCGNSRTAAAAETPDARIYGEKIKISGLCCANCARELEEELNKIDGVEAVVDFMNMRVILNAMTQPAREKAVYAITHFEDVKIVKEGEKKSAVKSRLKDLICIAVAALLFIPAFTLELLDIPEKNFAVKIIYYVFLSVAFLAVGHEVLIKTFKNIVKGKIFDENFLMTLASSGAIALGIFTGDGFAEGVAVMLLYQTGEFLQAVAVGSSRNSISRLMELKSDSATLLENGIQRVISPDELRVGDLIMIKAGEKVPADCRIVKGASSFDMKSLNGEPMPREISEGQEILSGSINLTGAVEAEVIREYSNSAVAKILELVENSTAKKSKPEKYITKFAKYYTPVICVAALIVAALVPTFICAAESAFVWATYESWIYKALNFLVISCPCALVISVPLSYFGGIGRCAKSGILVKGSTCLDELALAKVAAFDKTGTLTEGVFEVKNYSDEKVLNLAAAAEKLSSHPIAAAFAEVETDLVAEQAEEIAGKGIKCICGGKSLLCGNAAMLEDNGIAFSRTQSVSTLIYVALDGKYLGFVEIDDKIKDGAAQALSELKKSGIEHTEMLTGDLPERAALIAEAAGIDAFKAGLLPGGKLEEAENLKRRGKLIYVGDGINDAPVMTAADCAVSMGTVGSDAAIEASDIVLVSDNLKLLPKGRKIAKKTRSLVMQNIIGSLAVKAAVMALSVSLPGFPLIISVAADVGVMLIAVLNAMRTALIK